MSNELIQEENRNKQRDKDRQKARYAPKITGMPLGLPKGHWQRKKIIEIKVQLVVKNINNGYYKIRFNCSLYQKFLLNNDKLLKIRKRIYINCYIVFNLLN